MEANKIDAEVEVETQTSENVQSTQTTVDNSNTKPPVETKTSENITTSSTENATVATTNNTTTATNTAEIEEANSTISPLYSRWKNFSFSKVIENVKKQSESVKGVYQKDLSEFVNTIATESQNLKQKLNNMARSENASPVPVEGETNEESPKEPERISLRERRNSSLINKMSVGINSLLNKNKPEVPQKKKKIFDRKEALIYELQDDPLTYLIDPLYDPESSIERIQEYKKFTQKFDLFTYHVEIDKLLDEVEEVKLHHSTIVPARLPEEIFWQRYFFKLKELEDSEALKKQLVKGNLYIKNLYNIYILYDIYILYKIFIV